MGRREPFPRRAAVNSLGIGGTNAFVIVEEAPQSPVPAAADADRPWQVLPLSAKSPDALEALGQRFGSYLEGGPAVSLADTCFTAGVGRAHFDHRLAVVAASAEEARGTLAGVGTGVLVRGHAKHGERPRVAFLFTGQGAQYAGMGRELYQTHEEFRDVYDRCAEQLAPYLGRPLREVVYPAAGELTPIDDTAYTQPALFALEYALATLWRSWGIEPAVVIGHSVGELAAACVTGVFSLEDGLRLVAERGRLMQALPRSGAMAALRCEPARVIDRIAPYRDTVSIAAINGPAEVVISGAKERVEAIAAEFEREGITATRLAVSHAFHSPLMAPMLAEFERVARSISYSLPRTTLISNLTGAPATSEIATPDYWVRHVMQPVRFADGIGATLAHANVLLEIGPKPVLIGMARQCEPDGARAWLPSLRAGRSDGQQMAESLAGLYVCGAPVDWFGVHRGRPRRRVHLPTYPFQRQRYWMDPAAPADSAGSSPGSLVGRRLRLPGSTELRFETRWSADGPPYLTDHRLFETVVVPGASHMAMALTALKETSRQPPYALTDVIFPQALALPDDAARTAQIVFSDLAGSDPSFQVLSLRDGHDDTDSASWSLHAAGRIERVGLGAPATVPLAEWQTRCTRVSSGRDFYASFREAGYHLGPAFQWMTKIWSGEDELLCELTWPELPDDPAAYPLYPSLIDTCFQCVFGDTARDALSQDAVYVPFSVRRFTLAASPAIGKRLWCHVRTSRDRLETERRVDAEITVCDDAGLLVARFEGCQLREVRRDALRPESHTDLGDTLYEVEWRPEPRKAATAAETPQDRGVWVVFADAASSLADGLIERFRARGQRSIRVDAGPYRAIGPDSYQVDATSPDEVGRLLDDVSRDGQPIRGFVHLWGLDTAPMDEPTSAASREQAGSSLLHLVQALAQRDTVGAPRLWVVTRGAQPVEPWPVNLAVEQAPLWGFGRVLVTRASGPGLCAGGHGSLWPPRRGAAALRGRVGPGPARSDRLPSRPAARPPARSLVPTQRRSPAASAWRAAHSGPADRVRATGQPRAPSDDAPRPGSGRGRDPRPRDRREFPGCAERIGHAGGTLRAAPRHQVRRRHDLRLRMRRNRGRRRGWRLTRDHRAGRDRRGDARCAWQLRDRARGVCREQARSRVVRGSRHAAAGVSHRLPRPSHAGCRRSRR